jgi:hypothetical protein
MAIYPGANVRLLDAQYVGRNPMYAFNRVNLHVQAGTGSLYGFFNQPNRASSHFWVSYGGTVEQYQDTAYKAEADLDGNDATISIETEGGTGNSADTDGWTTAQIDAIVALVLWIMDTHGIPKVLATSSKTDSSSRGLSWHRLGIDGNFPALPDIRAGRKQRGGGMYYSSSAGKICPGGGKIQQIPAILDRVNGGSTPIPPPTGGGGGDTGGLAVDGSWGPATTRALQELMGTTVDGVISHQYKQSGVNYPGLHSAQWDDSLIGSNLIRAMQAVLGIEQDGLCGRDTITALQQRMGTGVDGVISTPYSNMVAEMQRRLKAGDAATS